MTLNTRTLLSDIQRDALQRLLKHLQCDIAAVQETRINTTTEVAMGDYTLYTSLANERGVGGTGIVVHNKFSNCIKSLHPINNRIFALRLQLGKKTTTFISAHSPTEMASEEEKDDFFDQLHQLIKKTPPSDDLIIGTDTNCQLGPEASSEESVGKWYYRMEETNDNGHRWLALLEENRLIFATTFRRPKNRNSILTWQGVTPLSEEEQKKRRMKSLRGQLDHFVIRKREIGNIVKSQSIPRAVFNSDHVPVVLTLRSSWRRKPNKKPDPRPDYSLLATDDLVRISYVRAVANGMGVRTRKKLKDAESWTETVQKAIQKWIPEVKRGKKKEYISDKSRRLYTEVLTLRRRKEKRAERDCRKELKESLRLDREKLWERRAEELDTEWNKGNTRGAYQLLRFYSGKLKKTSSIVVDEEGKLVLGEEANTVWKKYFEKLLNRPSPTVPPLQHHNRARYKISDDEPTEEEVENEVRKMKNGKAPGDDGIPTEALKHLPASGKKALHKIMVNIWREGRIPDSWRDAIILPLHKKGTVTSVENYRGISLLRTTFKLLERIILRRIINAREETAREEQCGFRPGRGTRDQIFTLRRIIEMHHESAQPLHVAFLDFASAFDSPTRDRLFEAIHADGMPPKILQLIQDMNTRTGASVKSPMGLSEKFAVETGVRQGAVLAPILFNYAIDDIMRRVHEDHPPEISLYPNQRSINDLEYADDIAVLAPSPQHLQEICTSIEKYSKAYGLTLRPEKCQQISIASKVARGVKIDGQEIQVVESFCYLGSIIQPNASCDLDIKNRVRSATTAFNRLNRCLWSTDLSSRIKLRVYQAAIRPILLYGSESWSGVARTTTDKIDAAERRFLRRLLGYFYPIRPTADEIYSEVEGLQKTFVRASTALERSRLRMMGHLLRRPDERIAKMAMYLQPQPGWKKRRGAPRKTWSENVKEQLNINDGAFGRNRELRRLWSSPNWMNILTGVAEDRAEWAAVVHGVINAAKAISRTTTSLSAGK